MALVKIIFKFKCSLRKRKKTSLDLKRRNRLKNKDIVLHDGNTIFLPFYF